MKVDGEMWRFAKRRQCKYLNNIVEQDHRRVERLIRPGRGFQSFHTAGRTIIGYEIMAIVRKGQVLAAPVNDRPAEAALIAALFGAVA
ncbi:DDE-type integrase/transposase/recombinase [Azospirillum largimobile]